MINGNKKLSIAFYWHMHQPVYQINPNSDYLMPWVRMHAVKDYLDMALLLNEFPSLKLNFNLVPILVNSLIDYGEKGFHDVHSRLSVTPIEELTDDDKLFILNNFFDANYNSMISHHKHYNELYEKRFGNYNYEITDYTNQDYSDIMAWFNLAWFDPIYSTMFPELKELAEKGTGYTLEDRINIIEFQRQIIRMIIPTYKKFIEEGRLELTTSPYYHPILPILLDIKCAHRNIPHPEELPTSLKMAKDAKQQVQLALDKMEEVFGKRPKGIWPPEHCVSSKTLEMLKDLGVEWTISDEGILANSINFDFVRDFKGYLEDPYYLLKTYEYKTQDSSINVIFRDSLIPNLISFEYPTVDSQKAANDLYDRIKVIQNKILTSPDDSHLLTIAIDGENCWENYTNDGSEFLKAIYSLIENDKTLETVLISDFVEADKNKKKLPKIYSGSWINRNFQLWIGEPVKNKAWTYLKNVKDDFTRFVEDNPNHPNIEEARQELFIAEGSDWFWWYGEPNNSGQDHIFDYLFREHLKNIYRLLELEIPVFLNSPLIFANIINHSTPTSTITPIMDGQDKIDDEWLNAGFISFPENSPQAETNLFKKMKFGFDEDNLYLRFYINEDVMENNSNIIHQLFIYMRNISDISQYLSPIRLINKSDDILPIVKEKFHAELRLALVNNMLRPLQFAKSSPDGLWTLETENKMRVAYDNVIDISIPFDEIEVGHGEMLEFFFISANFGVIESFVPKELLLTMQRPNKKN